MEDRTDVGLVYIDNEGKPVWSMYTVFYKDVDNYEDLPEVSKSRGTEKAFKRFKEKQKEEILSDKLIANLDMIHKRSRI